MADDQDRTSRQDAQSHLLQLDVGGMHCVNCGTLVGSDSCPRCGA